jgi:hypothetical protein
MRRIGGGHCVCLPLVHGADVSQVLVGTVRRPVFQVRGRASADTDERILMPLNESRLLVIPADERWAEIGCLLCAPVFGLGSERRVLDLLHSLGVEKL